MIHTATCTRCPRPTTFDARIEWIGADDRGVELPDLWLVIHVMPIALRRKP